MNGHPWIRIDDHPDPLRAQSQAVGISTGILLSSAKISKIVESNLRKASKILSGDASE
jgi:hypothetical protein